MRNKEKYSKKILEIVCDGSSVAIVNGKPRNCKKTGCHDCDFYAASNIHACNERFMEGATVGMLTHTQCYITKLIKSEEK